MFGLGAFNLYNKLLVQSMADLENCNGDHIIETLFYPAYTYIHLTTFCTDKISSVLVQWYI
jgi:hypothetical protein